MRISVVACFVLLVLAIGCSDQSYLAKSETPWVDAQDMDEASMLTNESGWEAEENYQPDKEIHPRTGSDVAKEKPSEMTSRKIIYNATLDVVVEKFDGIEKRLAGLVSQYGGFVASANMGRLTGERRSGTWQVRIPVANYQNFLNAVGDIGVPASRAENSSDVTAEYVDVEARIENKKKLEARIIKLLERPEDKIQHVIEVERELARVREDIERMEGRLRYLTNVTSLTTVTINIREERDYVPAQTPTFGNRIEQAWATSVANAQTFLENATVFIVRNAINFCMILVSFVFFLVVLRIVIRMVNRNMNTVEPL